MIYEGDRVLVALSGGGDSVALLYCLLELSPKMGFSITCAHLHHGIRGEEADRDEAFCRQLCEKENITLFTAYRDIPSLAKERSLSTELCGRQERYAFFEQVCKEYGMTKVATAHHLGDNAETTLLHLVRGAGPEGLRGIDPCRDDLIRPLIRVSRKEIEEFLSSRKISYVSDSSNLYDCYTRNKIRNRVIPVLEEINPSLGEGIFRMSELMRQENDYMEKVAQQAYREMADENPDQVVISLAPFCKIHPAIRRRILQLAYQKVTGQKLKSSLVFYTEALAARSIPSKKLYLGEAVAKIEYEKLIITNKTGENITELYEFEVQIGRENMQISHLGYRILAEIVSPEGLEGLKEAKIQKKFKVCLFNYDIICDKVICRNRKTGDSYLPLGGIGRRLVKKMMIDEKIPSDIRGRLPVFTCGEDILWVYGLRMNDNYKITPDTKRILKITVIEEKKNDK
jgi:tRNA(Ile)-lysidine synthase